MSNERVKLLSAVFCGAILLCLTKNSMFLEKRKEWIHTSDTTVLLGLCFSMYNPNFSGKKKLKRKTNEIIMAMNYIRTKHIAIHIPHIVVILTEEYRITIHCSCF